MIFSTSFAVMALSGLIGANLSTQIEWKSNYREAVALAAKEHKPLAVFIVKGDAKKLDQLPVDVQKVLKDQYIAVSINSADASGQQLAQAFELNEGIVISDRTGEKQAYRVEGKTTTSDLTQTLTRLAEPNRVATTTEVHGQAAPVTVTSFFAPAPYCPSCQLQKR